MSAGRSPVHPRPHPGILELTSAGRPCTRIGRSESSNLLSRTCRPLAHGWRAGHLDSRRQAGRVLGREPVTLNGRSGTSDGTPSNQEDVPPNTPPHPTPPQHAGHTPPSPLTTYSPPP